MAITQEIDSSQNVNKKNTKVKGINKKSKGKKKGEEEEEREDEETKLDIESKKSDKGWPGFKTVNVQSSRRDNFIEIVKERFCRKIKPTKLDDLVGSYNYVEAENITNADPENNSGAYETSMHQIKNFVVCNLIIPLASNIVRQRL